jgi:hypothetical protein
MDFKQDFIDHAKEIRDFFEPLSTGKKVKLPQTEIPTTYYVKDNDDLLLDHDLL